MKADARYSPEKGEKVQVDEEEDFCFWSLVPNKKINRMSAESQKESKEFNEEKEYDAPSEILQLMKDLKEIGVCGAGFKVISEDDISIDDLTDTLTEWCEQNIEGNFLDEFRCVVSMSDDEILYLSLFFAPKPRFRKEYYIERLKTTTFSCEEASFTLEHLEPIPGGQLAIFSISIPFINGFYMDDVRASIFANYGSVIRSIKTDPVKFVHRIHGHTADTKSCNYVLLNLKLSVSPQLDVYKNTVQYPPKTVKFTPLAAPPFLVEIKLITHINI